jgi:hypothetical protein
MTLTSRLDKVFTWILGVTFVLFILSGIDIQRRFLTPQISTLLHLKWMVLPAIAAFGYHTVYRGWRRVCKCGSHVRLKQTLLILLAAFLVFLMGYFLWYQFII